MDDDLHSVPADDQGTTLFRQPLYLKFRSSRVLSGLFPRVVLTVFQWCTKELSSQTQPQLHQNLARFYTDPA